MLTWYYYHQMGKLKTKVFIFFGIFIFVSTIFLNLLSLTASAAQASWKDSDTITYNGKDYSNPTAQYEFNESGARVKFSDYGYTAAGLCQGLIYFPLGTSPSSSTTAKFTPGEISGSSGITGCYKTEDAVTITITTQPKKDPNGNIVNADGIWKSKSAILLTSYDQTYTDSNPNDNNYRFEINSNQKCANTDRKSYLISNEDPYNGDGEPTKHTFTWFKYETMRSGPGGTGGEYCQSIKGTVTITTKGAADDPTANSSSSTEASCEGDVPVLGWFVCAIAELADDFVGWVEKELQSLLTINESEYNEGGLKTAWGSMRIVATVLLVGVALFMIISQMLNTELVSAYTIKKVVPRLVIATILIQLSWFLFTALIFVTNVIGNGLADLIYAPFGGANQVGDIKSILERYYENAGGNGTAATNTILLGVVTVFGISAVGGGFGLLAAALGVLIAVFIAFVVLVLRKVAIIFLLILAPLALVAWILPNTQKMWSNWWNLFSRLLLMFPMIMGMLAVGKVFAYVVAGAPLNNDSGTMLNTTQNIASFQPWQHFAQSASDDISNQIRFFIILIAYFGPFALIPMTFSLAGGVFARATGALEGFNKRARGGSMFGLRDRAKFRKENSAWAQSKKAREADRLRGAQLKQAERLTGGGVYSRYLRSRSGVSERGRSRAVANAGAAITSDRKQEFEERSALLDFEVRKLAKADNSTDSLYVKEVRARGEILKTSGEGMRTINGQSVMVSDELRADAAIRGLQMKDNSEELDNYVKSSKGFKDLADLGTANYDAYKVLADRLPPAVKGAKNAYLNDVRAPGFDNAIGNYLGLGKYQINEIQQALVTRLGEGADGQKEVVARLTNLARSDITQAQIQGLDKTFESEGLNLAVLRNNPNAALTYNSASGRFEIEQT